MRKLQKYKKLYELEILYNQTIIMFLDPVKNTYNFKLFSSG